MRLKHRKIHIKSAMSDIIDIITRLEYKADTKEVEQAYKAIESNIKAVDGNAKSIQRLESLREKTDKSNLARIAQIERALINRKAAIEKETMAIYNEVKVNEKLQATLLKQGQALVSLAKHQNMAVNSMGKLQQGSREATFVLTNLSYVVQDLPFGFIGIANNINPLFDSFSRLKAETGSTSVALKTLRGSLVGGLGIGLAVSVVSALLVKFGDELFKSSKETDNATSKTKSYKDAIKELNEEIIENIRLTSEQAKERENAAGKGVKQAERDLNEARARGESVEELYQKERKVREERLKELTREYVGYEKVRQGIEELNEVRAGSGLSQQEMQRQRARQLMIEELGFSAEDADKQAAEISKSFAARRAFINRMATEANAINEQVRDLTSQMEIDKIEFAKDVDARNKEYYEKQKKNSDDEYKNALQRIEDETTLKLLNDKSLQLLKSSIDTEIEIDKLRNDNRLSDGIHVSEDQRKGEAANMDAVIKRAQYLIKIREDELQLSNLLQKSQLALSYGLVNESNQFLVTADNLQRAIELAKRSVPNDNFELIVNNISGTDFEATRKEVAAQRREIEKVDTDYFKKQEDQRKKAIDAQKILYQQAASQIINTLQQIHDRQIQLLDMEIAARRDRVNEAVRLAEYGNTEILRQEQERMNKLQQERDKIVKKQIQQNAILQASSSAIAVAQAIQTVTNAGATGDPYSTAVRIAAAVAALASGFAFVTNLTTAFKPDAFKDGVINYQGKGTGTSDSNLVRISKGESVITAKATQQYLPILEAMNSHKPLPIHHTEMPYKYRHQNNNNKQSHEITIADVDVKTLVTNERLATLVKVHERKEKARWK